MKTDSDGKQKPLAFFSSKFDCVARALPHCVQAVVAASTTSSRVLFHPLTLKVPHAVSVILLQNKIAYLSPSRHLFCMAVFPSHPHLTIERCTILNPSTLLPTPADGQQHNCMSEISKLLLPRPDLSDTPLTEAALVVLGKKITIYTGSQYMFSTVHVFAQQWKNRGMVTSTGKPINHQQLILHLLDATMLPNKQIAEKRAILDPNEQIYM